MKRLFTPEGEAALTDTMRRQPLLAFDFDGTLAPIVARPDDARVPPAVAHRLQRLAGRLPVAIVSGRRVQDVRRRLLFAPWRIVGNHGAEDDGHSPADRDAAALAPLLRDELRRLDADLPLVDVRTLDALVESLGHTQLELVLNTLPGRHVAAALPEHLRDRLLVRERTVDDPLYLGFEAQQEFDRRVDDADWFLYVEDDIVLSDSLLLEKLEYFNANAPAEAVLLPHRYELLDGRKFYIDLWSKEGRPEDQAWNRLTLLEIGDWKFAEFENPHSGFFCLSQQQLRRWLASGRRWYGLASYVGPRESAATGALEECFRLYKPHPSNMTFLQIRHLGTKYAEFFSELHERAGA
jgi:hypothetical protein